MQRVPTFSYAELHEEHFMSPCVEQAPPVAAVPPMGQVLILAVHPGLSAVGVFVVPHDEHLRGILCAISIRHDCGGGRPGGGRAGVNGRVAIGRL